MDCRLELVTLPVADVDRAIKFYVDQVGFNLDYDHKVSPELRFVQLTPRGSACSIAIGVGLTTAEPGSVVGMQVVVDDADAARADLIEHGVDASEVEGTRGGGSRSSPTRTATAGPSSRSSGSPDPGAAGPARA